MRETISILTEEALDLGASAVEVRLGRRAMARVDRRLVPLGGAAFDGDGIVNLAREVLGNGSLQEARHRGTFHRLWIRRGEAVHRVDVHVRPDNAWYDGLSVTALILREQPPVPLTDHRLTPEASDRIRFNGGLVLVCGPLDAGRCDLMDSMLRALIEPEDASGVVSRIASRSDGTLAHMASAGTLLSQVDDGVPGMVPAVADAHRAGIVSDEGVGRPDAVLVHDVPGPETLAAGVALAVRGSLVVLGIPSDSAPAALRWLSANVPGDPGRALAHDVAASLSLVVARMGLPAVGGGRVPCHECLAISANDRELLQRSDPTEWHGVAGSLLTARRTPGTIPFAEDAERLHDMGLVSKETKLAVAIGPLYGPHR